MRHKDKLYWIKKLLEKIVSDDTVNLDIVIHGVYYPDEVKFLEKKGVIPVKIEIDENIRFEKIRKLAGVSKSPDEVLHEPPYLLEKYRTKYTIINRNPDDLAYEVKRILDKIRLKS